MILIGDVLFFKETDSLISRMIAKFTRSEFTHVALIVAFDEKTNIATIIESNRFVETKLTRIQLSEIHKVYTAGQLTDKQRKDIVKFAYDSIGTKYDYLLTIGIVLSLLFKGARKYFNSKNKLICSELIDLSYYKAGVPRNNSINIGDVTPQELIEVYNLEEVRKG